jgi:gamma-glutamyltranspeptidase/glutathione hydrolase
VTVAASGSSGVASGHPLAADAGLDILGRGGSAADAALAAAFTQWVVNAPLCGPGGDMVALAADAAQVSVHGGWSRVPLGFDPDATIVASGPRACAVPGSLAGAESLWRAHGRRPWSELFEAALAHAAGHQTTPRMAAVYNLVFERGHGPAALAVAGLAAPPAAGDAIETVELGRSLSAIADQGAAALYGGPIGEALARASEVDGGWIRGDDIAAIEAAVGPTVEAEVGDETTVWVPDWPSQAKITLTLLERVGSGVDPTSRSFAESLAPPTQELLTRRCVQGLAGTAASTAVDDAGLSVTVVHSLAGVQFGSGWVAGDTGIALGNRAGTALSNRPDLPAANPRPGAVLPHTLSAAHARIGDRWMTVATPGGDRQVQWLAQAVQRFRRGADPTAIVTGPRWFVCPEGDRFGVPGGIGQPWYAYAEPGIEWRDDEMLSDYRVKPVDNVGGGLQLAMGAERGGVLLGSDPRAGGAARAR